MPGRRRADQPWLLTDPRITFLLPQEDGEPVSASAHVVASGLRSPGFVRILRFTLWQRSRPASPH